jgi:hypothetical protein
VIPVRAAPGTTAQGIQGARSPDYTVHAAAETVHLGPVVSLDATPLRHVHRLLRRDG